MTNCQLLKEVLEDFYLNDMYHCVRYRQRGMSYRKAVLQDIYDRYFATEDYGKREQILKEARLCHPTFSRKEFVKTHTYDSRSGAEKMAEFRAFFG